MAVSLVSQGSDCRRPWVCQFRLERGGKRYKVSTGQRSRSAAVRFCERLEILIERRSQGDGVPPELLGWVGALGEATAGKLAGLGLVDGRARVAALPLAAHLEAWAGVVSMRSSGGGGVGGGGGAGGRDGMTRHARESWRKVERVGEWMGWLVAEDAVRDILGSELGEGVMRELTDRGLSSSTRSKYVVAVRGFAEWCVRTRRVREGAERRVGLGLEAGLGGRGDGGVGGRGGRGGGGMKMPREVAGWDRRPLEPVEFAQLSDWRRVSRTVCRVSTGRSVGGRVSVGCCIGRRCGRGIG